MIGLLLGATLAYGPRLLAWPVRALVDVIRGIPMLVLIFFVYYVLPAVGLDLGNFAAAVAAITLFTSCPVAEIARGASLFGPHRDDLRLEIEGRDARLFGSQGQQRTAVIALKLATLDVASEERGVPLSGHGTPSTGCANRLHRAVRRVEQRLYSS